MFKYFTPDCTKLSQHARSKPHFLWNDIQLSKGKLNKDRQIEVDLDGEKTRLVYVVTLVSFPVG